jgi:hypothetical protein
MAVILELSQPSPSRFGKGAIPASLAIEGALAGMLSIRVTPEWLSLQNCTIQEAKCPQQETGRGGRWVIVTHIEISLYIAYTYGMDLSG